MNYPLLSSINSPEDLKRLPNSDIEPLIREIRSFLIEICEKNGGHLASNLGVVELTLAIHRVFSSPEDKIIFDVGHQSYVHKLITGRRERFEDLRKPGGLSGFTKRGESEHDPFGAGHSSTSISAALGFAEADKLLGREGFSVAVIGDGAFTGGMAHEALNNCKSDLPLIIILNENGMSISSNKGAFASYLTRVRLSGRYQSIKKKTKSLISGIPLVSKPIGKVITYFKEKFKDLFLQSNYFEELGLHYIGPIDGNDFAKVEEALTLAKNFGETVVVHVVTKKGSGYAPAEIHPSTYHSFSSAEPRETFHSHFASELISLAEENKKITAVTAAMSIGTGLDAFECAYPDRYFDVGIAEEHGLTFSAGLCAAGLSPYFAVYSTFLQRGYDNLLHDIALQELPVRIMIDRAGISVGDGATHHGIFDVSMLLSIPKISLYAPISYDSLGRIMRETVETTSPVAIRYPNAAETPETLSRLSYISERIDSLVLSDFAPETAPENIFITYGRITDNVLHASDILKREGKNVGTVVLETLKPYKPSINLLRDLTKNAKKIVLCEEGIRNGGISEALLSELISSRSCECRISIAAIDDNFASPASPADIFDYVGLSAEKIAEKMRNND